MTQGSKEKYTDAQKQQAEHIEDSYKAKGATEEKAEAIAWATINKQSGGGERSGSGKEKSAKDKAAARRSSAKRAAASRKNLPHSESIKLETKDSLLKQARERNIRGRSTMNKQEFINALR